MYFSAYTLITQCTFEGFIFARSLLGSSEHIYIMLYEQMSLRKVRLDGKIFVLRNLEHHGVGIE